MHRLRHQRVTYTELGATRNPILPPGYRHDRRSAVLGRGDAVFGQGREALRGWVAHHSSGAVVTPQDAVLEPGTVVIVTFRLGPVSIVAPCRITSVTDTDERFGFAYGTLPGHPECGEEAFHIQRDAGGSVSFEIVAFSRPAHALARFGAPMTRAVQRHVTNGYLEGLRRYVVGARQEGRDGLPESPRVPGGYSPNSSP